MIQGAWATALSFVLLAGNTSLCAGWAPSPEARMACCADDDACPMHKREPHGQKSRWVVSQAQADSCCASSEEQHPTQSAPTSVTMISSAVLGIGVIIPVPVPALMASDWWRSIAPMPVAPVPKHLLLSVFLV